MVRIEDRLVKALASRRASGSALIFTSKKGGSVCKGTGKRELRLKVEERNFCRVTTSFDDRDFERNPSLIKLKKRAEA